MTEEALSERLSLVSSPIEAETMISALPLPGVLMTWRTSDCHASGAVRS